MCMDEAEQRQLEIGGVIARTSTHVLMLRDWGQPPVPWIFYRHAEGQWVSLRVATPDDLAAFAHASTKGPR